MITFSKLGRYGQLGNQLFQVGLLIGVSEKRGYQVKIPKAYQYPKKRGLVELQPFNITMPRLGSNDLAIVKNTFIYDDLAFNPEVFNQCDNTDFQGYFQSELYFRHAKARIMREFSFKPEINNWAEATARKLRGAKRLVALHVRRGDYLQNPDRFRIFTAAHLEACMNHSAIDGLNSVFLVFSDDHRWCSENLKGNWQLSVGKDHWHDLALMTKCDDFIISASSFSWWGAWLGSSNNKIVIAPGKWFPDGVSINTQDVIPESWIRFESGF